MDSFLLLNPPCNQTLHDVFIDKNSFSHVSKMRQECWTRQFLQGSGIPNDRGALTKKKNHNNCNGMQVIDQKGKQLRFAFVPQLSPPFFIQSQ